MVATGEDTTEAISERVAAAARRDRGALARLVSAVERGGEPAREVGRLVFGLGGAAHTVGVTGAPGVGKSTLLDGLVTAARARGREVGVLAVDPSSPFSGGALLGDRVRMQGHANDPGVFIRSLATRGHLGGLTLAVPEAIRVLDASGLGLILVETVGVGQVELDVSQVTDTTVVVLNPGFGDGVQANKAGVLEVADIFVINKADRPGARELRRDLSTMLEISGPSDWQPPILDAVASTGEGVSQVLEAMESHLGWLDGTGQLAQRRATHLEDELARVVSRRLEEASRALLASAEMGAVRSAVAERRLDPYAAAEVLLGSLRPAPARPDCC